MAGKVRPTAANRQRGPAKLAVAAGPVITARDQVTAVMARAKESGLISGKGGRISGRVSPELIERAKARTGLRSDTALVEFALANVAVEDDFARVFRALKGAIDPELDLGF